jgi:thiol-disulfide isomerase/thioredoxin
MQRLLMTMMAVVALVMPVAGRAAPELAAALGRLALIRGEAPTLADRVVMVAFFASWCPPCRAEFVHLNSVQRDYGPKGLQVVGVNVFEDFDGQSTPAKLETFLQDASPLFPVLRGDRAIRQTFGNLDRIPTLFVFARDGRLAMVFRHAPGATKTHLSEAELRAAVEPLL